MGLTNEAGQTPPRGKRGSALYDWPFKSLPNFQSRLPCSCFVLIESQRELAMGLDNLRSEIAFMRLQVSRQRKEILLLQRAGADYLG